MPNNVLVAIDSFSHRLKTQGTHQDSREINTQGAILGKERTLQNVEMDGAALSIGGGLGGRAYVLKMYS